ncbi:MAG: EscU/YscU/HrcU family type III secretion system export apparatus switch protein [Treponema sp.]|nr:EscU/YscU/HrcU family type III secretion system export apparatus switch protein [Treponema sp.]
MNFFMEAGAYKSDFCKIAERVRQSDCLVVGGSHRAVGLRRGDNCGSRVTVVCLRSEMAFAKQIAFANGIKVVENDALSLLLFRNYSAGDSFFLNPDEIENPIIWMPGKGIKKIVKKCDALVVCGNECAAGLRYDENTMEAPAVIYKSFDVGFSRRLAEESKVKVVENNSFAESLMGRCALDSEIPSCLFCMAVQVYKDLPKYKKKYKKTQPARGKL